MKVFTAEFVAFMGRLLNDKDDDFPLPAHLFERLGPGTRFRRLAAQKNLAPAISKIEDLVRDASHHNIYTGKTVLHVIEEPAVVFVLGRTDPVIRVVLSDGKESVYAILPTGQKSYPAKHSYIDVEQWTLGDCKQCIFEGAQHIVANVLVVLQYSTYMPKYGAEKMEVRKEQ